MYVATDFDISVKATVASGTFTMTRHIELTFAKTGQDVARHRVPRQRCARRSTGTTTTTASRGNDDNMKPDHDNAP